LNSKVVGHGFGDQDPPRSTAGLIDQHGSVLVLVVAALRRKAGPVLVPRDNNNKPQQVAMASPTEEEKIFLDALSVLTEPQKALLISLYRDLGQKHLFDEDFFNDAAPPSQRRQFAAQLLSLDQEYTNGGLEGYITKARKLLAGSQKGVNPLEGWTPSVPKGQLFDLGTSQYKEKEAEGIQHLGSCGFVLVAGGLGERLGYTGIKVRTAGSGRPAKPNSFWLAFPFFPFSLFRSALYKDWVADRSDDEHNVPGILH
jgi:hypothetical protein